MQSPVLMSHSFTLWSEDAVIRYLTTRVNTKQTGCVCGRRGLAAVNYEES